MVYGRKTLGLLTICSDMVLGLKVCSSTEFAEAMNSENMIPSIKLFGRKILAPERHFPADSHTPTSEFPTNSQTSVENPVKSSAVRTSQSPEKGNLDPNGGEKTFKKPDKILPCPRCNSLETKFCYFNNYNVNQPRHFCKNCQRYWTAGGTMRNVPIGAGRRKNKQFTSHYHEASNGAQTSKIGGISDTANHHHHIANNVPSSESSKGAVLKFGLDNCVSESVESCSGPPTLIHHPLQYHQQIPALFLPWNGNGASFQWCSSPNVAIPEGPLNIPLQFVAAPCVPMYTGGVFNGGQSSASNDNALGLGKHSRDPNGGILESSCLLPKVQKIDSNKLEGPTQLAGSIGAFGSRSKGECSGSNSRG